MSLSYRSRVLRDLECEFPAFAMVGSMPVRTWKSILLRAGALCVPDSVVGGVNLVNEFLRERAGCLDMCRCVREACLHRERLAREVGNGTRNADSRDGSQVASLWRGAGDGRFTGAWRWLVLYGLNLKEVRSTRRTVFRRRSSQIGRNSRFVKRSQGA